MNAAPLKQLQARADPLGDEFAVVYGDLHGLVSSAVRRVIRDRAMAEETVQEVFLELWSTAENFDGSKGSLCGWVTTIARRRAIDRVRGEESRSRREMDDHLNGAVSGCLSGFQSDAVTTVLDRQQMVSALKLLDVDQRLPIVMAFYGGRTYRDVAHQLQLPEGTVKRRIRDGLRKLRSALDNPSW